jgi:hypothetical protein
VIASDANEVTSWPEGSVFTGAFDGNGHTISHLTIEGIGYLGLFGRLGAGSVVSNVGLDATDVNGIGGQVGGLVGENFGHITTSYSSGSIRGDYLVGGLAGVNLSGGIISTSYSTGTVRGMDAVGGLVGAQFFARITMSYSASVVNGDSDAVVSVGGFVGDMNYARTESCFWDVEASGQPSSAGGRGLTTAEMQTADTFLEAGWDFVDETENGTEDIWWILEGQDYPRLWWELDEVEEDTEN